MGGRQQGGHSAPDVPRDQQGSDQEYQEHQGEEMNITYRKQVRKMFNVDYVPRELNRINQWKWVTAVRMLGDKWLLAQNVVRKDN